MIEALAEDGVYRSQFETMTSNGGLTAYPGGARAEIAGVARDLVNNGFITRWKDYDLQHLKKVWHCIAKFGSPIAE